MGRWRSLYEGATRAPGYLPEPGDRGDIRVFGADLPIRASVALLLVTLLVLLDYTRAFIPLDVQLLGRAAAATRYQALERVALFGLVPLVVVIAAFRDRPARYGLQLGDWRWGAALLAIGLAIMTPVVLLLAAQPDFRAYYGVPSTGLGDVVLTNVLDLVPAEFLLRGFLLFVLLRRIGPLALIVVQMPFIFAHIGKPELELYSTFLGGSVFAWLNWRTGSILWSAIGHIYILTLIIAATAG